MDKFNQVENEINDVLSDLASYSDDDIEPMKKKCKPIVYETDCNSTSALEEDESYSTSESEEDKSDSDCESEEDKSDSDCESEEDENDSSCESGEDENTESEAEIDISDMWNEIDIPPRLESFEGIPGMTIQEFPENIFELFFTDDFFLYMCHETNKYHNERATKYKAYKNALKWTDVTTIEMKRFLGLIILMGQVKKSTFQDYWAKDPLIETPIFAKIMTRTRFQQIWTFLHFNDNTQIKDDSDRLIKIQPILDHFLPKFQEFYSPAREISLDEGMIPWRGRLSFRTYNPAKIIKYGLLVWAVCESKSGYLINLEMYCAKGKKLQDTMLSVLRPVLGKWHYLYQDNYYNSVQNAELLLKHKTRVCGTIRENRGLPIDLKNNIKKMKKGDVVFRRKGDCLLLIFKDKRDIKMISTIHSAEVLSTGKHNRKTKENIVKPLCIIEYNKFMKGVDRADQYLSYYSIIRKTIKWTKKAALYIMNIALFNSFVIYKAINPNKKIVYKKYLLSVARAWLTEKVDEMQPTTSRATGPTSTPPGRLSGDMKKHTLETIKPTKNKKYPTRICQVCKTHGVRSETRYVCKFCEVPLHKGSCFTDYHTKKNTKTFYVQLLKISIKYNCLNNTLSSELASQSSRDALYSFSSFSVTNRTITDWS